MTQITRRNMIADTLTVLAAGTLGTSAAQASRLLGQEPAIAASHATPQYRIAVCDWMILKRQKLGALERTKQIGADGVEIDMGPLGDRDTFDSSLADAATRTKFLETAQQYGVAICSLAMSGFYAQSFAERPTVMRMIQDCLDTMRHLKVQRAFLPLGVKGDLVQHPELRPQIVARLKSAGKMFQDAGCVLGVETSLNAQAEVGLLDEVDSPAVQSYFNFANALQAGRDLCQELRTLGQARICQIHCTDIDGQLLQDNPRLNLHAVKGTLDQMHWQGWLVIERSRKANDAQNVLGNYGANAKYLKSIFQS